MSQVDKKRSEEDAAAHRKTGEDTLWFLLLGTLLINVYRASRTPTARLGDKCRPEMIDGASERAQ